jgi:hypothetical protein
MHTLCREMFTVEPTAVPIAFKGYSADLTTDPIVIAYTVLVFAKHID